MNPQEPPKILVADDNEEMRLYLRHILNREGFKVLDAVDGEQALLMFQEAGPDLVLLDGVMPKMDGFTVCEKIRALPEGRKVPIIMVTALDDSKSVDLAFEALASEYITKPVHWNFLLQRVQHLLTSSQAEARIAATEARMQAIFATVVDGIITINEAGIIEEFNPAAEKMFGYQAGEVLGSHFGMLLPEPFRSELLGYLQNYLKGGEAKLIGRIQEVQGLGKDGHTFPMEFSVSELLLPGKRVFTAIFRDIAERKKAEEIQRQSEAFVHDILNSLNFSVAVLDSSGKIVAVNDEWSNFFAENDGEVDGAGIGVSYLDVCRRATGPDRPDAVKAVAGIEAIMSGRLSHFELEYSCHSPRIQRWFLMQAGPLKSRMGSVIVSHLNITGRKEAEGKIRKSESSLQEAQRIAHLGNWDWDIFENILHWSDEIYRIFGLTPQSFQGTYEAFLASVHPDDREIVKVAVERALAGAEPYDVVHRIVRPDGTELIVHEQGEVFREQGGRPLRMVGTVRDVTKEKLAERKLLEYSEGLEEKVRERTAEYEAQKVAAEQSSKVKDEFLANVTHELKTPLNAIIGFAEILQQEMLGPMNEEQAELISDIVDSSRDLNEMVSVILQVSSLEKGTGSVDFQPFDLGGMLASVLEHYKNKAEAKGLRIEVAVDEGIDELYGCEKKIREVLMALLSNAIKFSPAGETIGVAVGQKADQVEICVVDQGPGISKEDQGRLFQPFTQLDSSFTKAFGGTGMGLYLARQLVAMHGGRIWVESAAGAGSRFCFSIPRPFFRKE